MKNTAQELAESYEFEHAHEYYEYINDSSVNGHGQQVLSLFHEMDEDSKREFLNEYATIEVKSRLLNTL